MKSEVEQCVEKFFCKLDVLIQQVVQEALWRELLSKSSRRRKAPNRTKSITDHVWELGRSGQPVTASALARRTKKSVGEVSNRLRPLCKKGQLKTIQVSGEVLYIPVLER